MRILAKLFWALVFFALFAFALNNQEETSVRWFFGYEWRAPMVIVVLVAFAAGCGFGVLAMVPSWWKHRRVARRQSPLPASETPSPSRRRRRPISRPSIHPAMDFELPWLQWGLLAIPLAFALGWLASRMDLRQWRREQRHSPKPYFKGLNLLLNEQQDKAIDAFIEAVQQDPQSSDLHFALGNLFRRRGEFERAVRVHEHLLHRADLPGAERQRAQHALAQDYMKAGLFDRAEAAYRALEGTPFDTEARLALLGLYERSRDWKAAAETAARLERSGTGSFAARIAHHWCELAQEADERGQPEEAAAALRRALEVAPHAPRAWVLAGRRAFKAGDAAAALEAWNELRLRHPASFLLVAADYARAAQAAGQAPAALEALQSLQARQPSIDLLHAMAVLDADPARQRERTQAFIATQPTLSAAQDLLQLPAGEWTDEAVQGVRQAVARAAKPLRRYRCAACGFEAKQHFWQCPGCQSWDSYPPRRVEEL